MVFAIHQYDSAIGIHVSPPFRSHPSILSQSTSFRCPESYITLARGTYFTYDKVCVSVSECE